ncbi:MAG: hypothetical protein R3E97_10790 [Candidatus Eisenbacteria bacterium]
MSRSLAGTLVVPARSLCTLALLGSSLLLPFRDATAAYEENVVNDDTFGEENRIDPLAVPLTNGNYLAFWADNGRGHTDILARLFDSSFSPLENPTRINTDEGLVAHRELAASPVGGGRFLLVWEDRRHGDDNRAIYARRFDGADGAPLGEDFRVDGTLGFGSDLTPKAHTSPDGESLIVWVGRVNQRNQILGRRISADGTLGQDFVVVPESSTRNLQAPSVTRTPAGSWLVAWHQEDDGRDFNVYFRLLSADGTPTGTPTRADTDLLLGALQMEPDAALVGNQVLLVWNDGRQGTADLWGRWIALDGTPDGSDFLVRQSNDLPSDRTPKIVPAGDGSYAITWFGGIDDRQRAMAQYYDASGERIVGDRIVHDLTSGVLQRASCVAPAGDGTWWELWSDDRTGPWNCMAQLYDPSENTTGNEFALYTAERSSSQLYSDVSLFPNGEAVVTWADFQSGYLEIRARFLDVDGFPTGESFRVGSSPVNADITTLDAYSTVEPFSPRVGAGATGFVVTWAVNQEGGRLNYWAQYYDRDGVPIGDNFLVAPNDQERPQNAAVPIMLPHGGFGIALQIQTPRGQGSDADVILQLFQDDGLPIEPRTSVADQSATGANQIDPAIAVSPFGTILISWSDDRAEGWDVMSQRFSESGQKVGVNENEHAPDEFSSDQIRSAAALLSDRTVVVWDSRPLTQGLLEGRLVIFATAAGPTDGTDVGAGETVVTTGGSEIVPFQVNAGRAAAGVKSARVAMAPDGRFIVSWWENADNQSQLVAQRYDAHGDPIGSPYPIHGNDLEGSRLPAALSADNDRILFSWSDSRRNLGWDVRTRLVDWDFSGAPTPVLLRTADIGTSAHGVDLWWSTASEIGFEGFLVHRQSAGETPSSGLRADAVLVTEDLLFANEDGLYAFSDLTAPARTRLEYFLEAVDSDGGTELFGPLTVATGDWAIASAWPNPFRDSVTLALDDGEPIDLDLYDTTGRLVRRLSPAEGEATLRWDGKDARGLELPAGVYFARPRSGQQAAIRVIKVN